MSSADPGIHVFDNGLRLYTRHISAIQAARYRDVNLHEPVEEEWFHKLTAGEDGPFRFADVGAGVGYYAMLVKRLRPSAHAFCFEPLHEHAGAVAEHLALNAIEDGTVQVFEVAVSDRSGRHLFHRENFGSRLTPEESPDSVAVEVTTLGAIVEGRSGPLDLVKIDVQGDELRVIAGAGLAPIRAWIVGTHSPALHVGCIDALRRRGCTILFEDPHPPHQPDGLVVAVGDIPGL